MCYLAAEGGKRPRRELAELLWPKSEERRARTDLRSILTSIRKTLEEGGARGHGHGEGIRFLATDGDLLGVERQAVELDLRTLEAAVSLARSETSETSPDRRSVEGAVGHRDLIARLEEALGTYGAEAHRSRSREAEIVRRLADGIGDRELRRRFLSATPVRSVLDVD